MRHPRVYLNIPAIPDTPTSYPVLAARLWRAAWPFVATRAIELATDTAAMMIYSRTGEDYAATASSITSSRLIIRSFFISVLFYTAQLTAESRPQSDALIGALQATWLLSFFACIPSILLSVFIKPILMTFNQPEAVSALSGDHFRHYAVGLFFIFITLSSQQFLIGLKKALTVLLLTLITKPSVAILTYLLMSRNTSPALTRTGMGIAYEINGMYEALAHCVYLIYLFPKVIQTVKVTRNQIKNLVSHGVNIAIYNFVELASSTLTAILIGHIDKKALAAFAPALHYASFIGMVSYAFGIVVGVIVRNAVMANKLREGIRYGKAGILTALLIPLIALTAFLANPELLVSAFLKKEDAADPDLIWQAKLYTGANLFGQVFETACNVGIGVERGYQETRYPMWANIVSKLMFQVVPACVAVYAFQGDAFVPIAARNAAIIVNTAAIYVHVFKLWKKHTPKPAEERPLLELQPTNNTSTLRHGQ